MDKFSFLNAAHSQLIEDLYQQYLKFPDSVEPSWKSFFQGFDFALEGYGDDFRENSESSKVSAPVQLANQASANSQIPEDIQKEFHILNEHCEYPIEFDRPIGNQGSATTQNFLEKSSRHGLFAAEKESLSTNKIGNKHHGDYVSPNAESSKEDSQKHSDNSHYRHQTET